MASSKTTRAKAPKKSTSRRTSSSTTPSRLSPAVKKYLKDRDETFAQAMTRWRKDLPRGTKIACVLLAHAASGTRTVMVLHAPAKNEIVRVIPIILEAAGFRYSFLKDAVVMPGSGYFAELEIAQRLGHFLHGSDDAITYRNGLL